MTPATRSRRTNTRAVLKNTRDELRMLVAQNRTSRPQKTSPDNLRIGYLYPKAWSSRPNTIISHYFVVSGISHQHIGFHRHVPRNARVSRWRGAVVDVCEILSHV